MAFPKSDIYLLGLKDEVIRTIKIESLNEVGQCYAERK